MNMGAAVAVRHIFAEYLHLLANHKHCNRRFVLVLHNFCFYKINENKSPADFDLRAVIRFLCAKT